MDTKLKSKWVKALRSGKYRQAKDDLRRGKGFCCLGVLCDIQGAEWKKEDRGWVARLHGKIAHIKTYGGTLDGLLRPFAAGGLRKTSQQTLSEMNDSGRRFKTIAAYIEENF